MEESKSGVWCDTEEELINYLHEQEDKPHDYNTIAEALTNVTVAMFNYFAKRHGMTGFQAGWAGMNFLKVTRGLESPFGIVDGSKLLYPQYDLHAELDEWIEKWKPEIGKLAKQNLEESNGLAAPQVIQRWEELSVYAEEE